MKYLFSFLMIFLLAYSFSFNDPINSARKERQIIFQNPNNSNGQITISASENADSGFTIKLPIDKPDTDQVLNVKSVSNSVISTEWNYPRFKAYAQTASVNTTVTDSTSFVVVAAPCTLNLPSAKLKPGQAITIKKIYSGNAVFYFYPVSGETIESMPYYQSNTSLAVGLSIYQIMSDGSNWWLTQKVISVP